MKDRDLSSPLWLVPILGLLALQVILFRGFIPDDAFISFRVAEHLAQGDGLVYNVNERIEGYSNLLWVLLLALFSRIGVEVIWAAKGLGVLFSAATLVLTWHISRRWSRLPVAALFLAASGPFGAWAMGCLATPLFTLLLLAATWTFVGEESRKRGWHSGWLFGLLVLTRPEGLFFAGIAGLVRLHRLYRGRARRGPHDGIRAGLLVTITACLFGWRLVYYGDLLPNSMVAKSMGLTLRAPLEGIHYLFGGLVALGGAVLLVLPGAAVIKPSERFSFGPMAAAMFAGFVVFILIGGGDWMPLHRFWVHLMPLLFLTAHAGLLVLLDRFSPLRARRILWAVAAAQVGYLLVAALTARMIDGHGKGGVVPPDTAVIAHLKRHVRPQDTIAVIDAGLIAYRLPRTVRVVDIVGLTNRHIARRPRRFPSGLLGRGDAFGKWDVDYVLDQRPRFVQAVVKRRGWPGPWRTNFTGTDRLLNDPRFKKRYRYVRAPRVSGLFVRRSPDLTPQ
jgi:arabinofuranosyltransferase